MQMMTKSFILVMILSFHVDWQYCQNATAPTTTKTTAPTTTKTTAPSSEDDPNLLAIVLPICLILATISAAVAFYICWRRMKIEKRKNNFNGRFKVTDNESFIPDDQPDKDKISTLGNLAEDVTRRKLEIPREYIFKTDVRLGRGNFAEVQQVLVRKPDEPEMLCAAKKARRSHILIDDMLDELEIHLQLAEKHENIVNLIGVCSSSDGPFYIIVEYCENGSLKDYLRRYEMMSEYVNLAERETLSLEWKLARASEICNGMKYLAEHKIVHRDLAARNILLDSNTVAKISDFGMAKDVYLQRYYKQKREGCFPLRWMAIESIEKLSFSEKSDVWSFGVLVWEIFTDGSFPYFHIIDDQQVAYYILEGKKLTQPQNCPKFLYSIMLKCWSDKSYNRPNFAQLHRSLTEHTKQQPKRGARRFSRDILKRFGESSINLRRKLSRKGRRKSADSSDQLTNSRRPSTYSYHGLHNDMELQIHQPLEHDKRRKSVKKDENQRVDPLDKIEEDKLEKYPDNEDGLSNSANRSCSGKAPYDSSHKKETRSSPSNKNPSIKSSTDEDIPSTSSKAKMVENNIKDMNGENNSEISPNVSPNDSLNKDQGREDIDNLQDPGVNDDSTTDLTSHLMNMMDDVLGVDQQRRDSTNNLDSKNLPKSDQPNDHQDFSLRSNTTEGNTLSKMEDGSGQSAKDNPIDNDARSKTKIIVSTIPKNEPKDCMTTGFDDLSEDSSKA